MVKYFFSKNSFVELVVPFSQSNRLRDPIRHAQLNIQLLSMSVTGCVNRKISPLEKNETILFLLKLKLKMGGSTYPKLGK